MIDKVFFTTDISLGQKTVSSGSAYGDGYNYRIQTGIKGPLGEDDSKIRRQIQTVIQRLDHKALGLDLDLGFEPTSPAICAWLFQEVGKAIQPAELLELRMLRGDGYQVFLTLPDRAQDRD